MGQDKSQDKWHLLYMLLSDMLEPAASSPDTTQHCSCLLRQWENSVDRVSRHMMLRADWDLGGKTYINQVKRETDIRKLRHNIRQIKANWSQDITGWTQSANKQTGDDKTTKTFKDFFRHRGSKKNVPYKTSYPHKHTHTLTSSLRTC